MRILLNSEGYWDIDTFYLVFLLLKNTLSVHDTCFQQNTCPTLKFIFVPQNWEEEEEEAAMEEKMEEDKEEHADEEEDPGNRTDSKANGEEDMEHGDESEEE